MAQIQFNIPDDINKRLICHLVDLRSRGVKTTKAELCIKLLAIGLKQEEGQ